MVLIKENVSGYYIKKWCSALLYEIKQYMDFIKEIISGFYKRISDSPKKGAN